MIDARLLVDKELKFEGEAYCVEDKLRCSVELQVPVRSRSGVTFF
jgi:hypothetical protein